ncbi:MAG TPA: hypothetical protein VKS81_05215 [Bacteroidota bacterium]|nr:hypothetical protein [Bacteroidota bacterium]
MSLLKVSVTTPSGGDNVSFAGVDDTIRKYGSGVKDSVYGAR